VVLEDPQDDFAAQNVVPLINSTKGSIAEIALGFAPPLVDEVASLLGVPSHRLSLGEPKAELLHVVDIDIVTRSAWPRTLQSEP
jgi:hypothetical protein